MNSRDIIRSLMTNSDSVIFFKDSDGRFELVNQRWIDLYRVDLKEIVGRDHAGGYRADIASQAREVELQVEESGRPHTREVSQAGRDGLHYHLVTCFPVRGDGGEVVGTGTISTEITDHKRLQRDLKSVHSELQELSIRDPLTGACSRALFDERLAAETSRHLRYHRPLVLLLVDINQFGQVNEAFGYAAGDQVLVRVVELIQELLRDTDSICRYEGDRFAVVAPETTVEGGPMLADRIVEAIRQDSFPIIDALTASVGGAALVEGDDHQRLLQRAHDALEEAKRAGKGRSRFYDM